MMTARSDRSSPPPHCPPPSCCVFAKILPARLSFHYELLFVCISSILHSILHFFHKLPSCLMSHTSNLFSVSTLTSPRRCVALFISPSSPSLAHSVAVNKKNRASLSSTSSPSFATLSLLRASSLISCPTSSTHTK